MISLLVSTSILLGGAALAHPDHHEQDLLYHFAAGTHEIQNGVWPDKTHNALAQVHGKPRFLLGGPTEALQFTGQEHLTLAGSAEEAQKLLPKREMSVATWIRLDDTLERGSIVSYWNREDGGRGWTLGFG